MSYYGSPRRGGKKCFQFEPERLRDSLRFVFENRREEDLPRFLFAFGLEGSAVQTRNVGPRSIEACPLKGVLDAMPDPALPFIQSSELAPVSTASLDCLAQLAGIYSRHADESFLFPLPCLDTMPPSVRLKS